MRDILWGKAIEKLKDGGVTQIWSARNSQGYDWRQFGAVKREFIDFEGLFLTAIAPKGKRVKVSLRDRAEPRRNPVDKVAEI